MKTYEVTIRRSEPITCSLLPDNPPASDITPFSEQKTYILKGDDMPDAIKKARQQYKSEWTAYKAVMDAQTSQP